MSIIQTSCGWLRWSILVSATCLTLGIPGCGKQTGLDRIPVSGKVTYKGVAVKNGTIVFGPSGAGTPGTATITDGDYSVEKGLPAGTYVVVVNAVKENLIDLPPVEAQKKAQDNLAVPKKYTEAKTSDLKLTVNAGDSSKVADFDLQD